MKLATSKWEKKGRRNEDNGGEGKHVEEKGREENKKRNGKWKVREERKRRKEEMKIRREKKVREERK